MFFRSIEQLPSRELRLLFPWSKFKHKQPYSLWFTHVVRNSRGSYNELLFNSMQFVFLRDYHRS